MNENNQSDATPEKVEVKVENSDVAPPPPKTIKFKAPGQYYIFDKLLDIKKTEYTLEELIAMPSIVPMNRATRRLILRKMKK